MSIAAWESEIEQFWDGFAAGAISEDDAVTVLDPIADRCPADDGRADFERAGVRDSVGRTAEAVELYRRGLAAGLDPDRIARTQVQLGSSLRVVGDLDGALEVLADADPTALGGAPMVVRALTLRDAGRPDEALRCAIEAAVPHLPRYQRAMAAYARQLTD